MHHQSCAEMKGDKSDACITTLRPQLKTSFKAFHHSLIRPNSNQTQRAGSERRTLCGGDLEY